jgi:hypothetical protein
LKRAILPRIAAGMIPSGTVQMAIDIGRRVFMAALGGAVALPLSARAQQSVMPVIGYLSSRSADAEAPWRVPFLKGLEAAGFVPSRNVAIRLSIFGGRGKPVAAAIPAPICAARQSIVRRGAIPSGPALIPAIQ